MISHSATIRLLLSVMMWSAVSTTVAHAQVGYGRPNDRPTFSPYINLLRRGRGGAAYDYFSVVRPQLQMYEQNQELNQGLLQLQQGGIASTNAFQSPQNLPGQLQMGITGHPTVFMSFDGGTGGSGFAGAAAGGGGLTGSVGLGSSFGGGFQESDPGAGFGAGDFSPDGGISVGPGFGGTGYGVGGSTGHPATFGAAAGGSLGLGGS